MRETVLHPQMLAEGGKMVDFHGWQMPLHFAGITAEHQAVRHACGCFDLGHMGRLRLAGAGALAFLETRISRALASMRPGQVRYGLVCNTAGGVEDDVLVSREADESFHVVVNAGNRDKILQLWSERPSGVALEDLTQAQAMLACQGPGSAALLAGLGLPVEDLPYYRFRDTPDQHLRLSRTGYTGEDGFELFCPAAEAPNLWQRLRAAGATACGLGCRDSLRLEAGMPLYGQELDPQHTPIEAGLSFAVGPDKDFIGAEVLRAQLRDGVSHRLVGLRIDGPRPARPAYPVLNGESEVGLVTSGGLSPSLGYPIALAYVSTLHAALGTSLTIDIRGKTRAEATVVPLPFYKRL